VVEETLKMKGIRQNVKALENLTFAAFNNLVEQERHLLYSSEDECGEDEDPEEVGEVRPEIHVRQYTIRRDFAKKVLRSSELSKRVRMLSNKRYFPSQECFLKVFPNEAGNPLLRTLPWGYCFDD